MSCACSLQRSSDCLKAANKSCIRASYEPYPGTPAAMYRFTYHGESDGTSQITATTPPSPSAGSAQVDEPPGASLREMRHSVTVGQLPVPGLDRKTNRSSATWTSSSGDVAGHSDTDDVEDRPEFVQEYNRLARKASFPLFTPWESDRSC